MGMSGFLFRNWVTTTISPAFSGSCLLQRRDHRPFTQKPLVHSPSLLQKKEITDLFLGHWEMSLVDDEPPLYGG